MPDRETLAMWRSRLRWRLRGAWQWPTFAVLTVIDAVVLARLPFAGGQANLLGSLLAAGFLNLIMVAVVGRLGGVLLRRRQRILPPDVAADRAGTAGMVALAALLLVGGLAHRDAVTRDERARDLAIASAQDYARRHAPVPYVHNVSRVSTAEPGPDFFRICFAGDDPDRAWCVFVRTDEPAPIIRHDADQRPNDVVFGPGNPGRAGG